MEWFYEQDGQQVGPVSRAEIIRLIVQRRIQPQTLVWTAEFGDQWRPAIKAGLMVPLPPRFRASGRPGPAPWPDDKGVAAVPSLWAWIFLLVPHGLMVLERLISYLNGHTQPSYVAHFFLVVILFMSLSLDRRVLRMSGIRPPSIFWFVFFPGYFVMRHERLGRGKVLVVASIVMMMLELTALSLNPLPGMDGKTAPGLSQLLHSPAQQQEASPTQGEKQSPSSPAQPGQEDEQQPSSSDNEMSI